MCDNARIIRKGMKDVRQSHYETKIIEKEKMGGGGGKEKKKKGKKIRELIR